MTREQVRTCDGCRKQMEDRDTAGFRTVVGKARIDLCDDCKNAGHIVARPADFSESDLSTAEAAVNRIAWLVLNSAKTGAEAKNYD